MARTSPLGNLLYWLMVLAGGALLAPCLILPAWLEYRLALDLRSLRSGQVETLEREITKARAQREQIAHDDAYVLRLARQYLNVETPGIERIHVAPGSTPLEALQSDPQEAESAEPSSDELVPELSERIEQAMVRYPWMHIFVQGHTRPWLLVMGAGLIFSAIVLLGRPVPVGGRDDETPDEEPLTEYDE